MATQRKSAGQAFMCCLCNFVTPKLLISHRRPRDAPSKVYQRFDLRPNS